MFGSYKSSGLILNETMYNMITASSNLILNKTMYNMVMALDTISSTILDKNIYT